MNENINFQQPRKIETSLAKTFKSRTSIISILLIAALVIVSLFLSSITPLSAQTTQLLESKPQFNMDVIYAFVGQGPPNATYTDSNGHLMSPVSQYPSAVYFNVTRSTNVETVSCDALIEVFKVKIASDKGPAENYAYFEGTNYNPSFSDAELTTLTVCIYDLIDLSTVDGVSGHFCFNWTAGESILSKKVGSFGSYNNYKNGLGLWSAGQPNTISVTVHRIGYVTMTNGAISVLPATISTNNITQVQLQKYGDSFLNNKIVPTDKLPQTDLFHPLG
jgi:hypothetical protein